MNEKHIGSDFDDFLAEEGLLAEAEAIAIKRVIAFQIESLMKEQKVTKSEMAKRMATNNTSIEQLLDPANETATIYLLEQAALALGKRLEVALV